jgi:DNA-binding transcriptional LysR family regulator
MFDPDYDLFLLIVDLGSISGAARAQGLSVAAVSKRLARLEERLATRLVNRTTRRLGLTDAGRELYETLLPLRSSLKAAEDRVAGRHSQVSGSLRVTAPTSFGRMHILPCLPAFLEAQSGLELTIDLSDEYVDLLDSPYDLAIRIGTRIGAGLMGERLGTSRRVLCAAPAYIAQFGMPEGLAELAAHRLLATESQLPWHLQGPEGAVVQNGRSHVRTNSSEVVRELALGGCGIALRSMWDVSEALESGALVRLLPRYQGSEEVGIHAVCPAAPSFPARVRALIDHLRANLRLIDTI